jgi:hypothetical protein
MVRSWLRPAAETAISLNVNKLHEYDLAGSGFPSVRCNTPSTLSASQGKITYMELLY